MTLGMALFVGFSIARFAVVLQHGGYGKNGNAALKRYRQTFFSWLDYFRFPLSDPTSRSRRAVYAVRRVHGFARRQCKRLFAGDQDHGDDDSCSEDCGVPLSQYDLAEVQLVFSGTCLSLVRVRVAVSIQCRCLQEQGHLAWFASLY
jgi:hypothetical protein